MDERKFDPRKLHKLNNPKRLQDIPPPTISARLGLSGVNTIIEIGAGTGFFSIAFIEQYRPATLYACDVSETMLDWVRDNVVPRYPAIIPVKSEETTVPLDDGMADLVFMINLHHELKHPPLILQESHRLLRPGGVLFIVDWKKQAMDEGPPKEIRCDAHQVSQELLNAGFQDITTHDDLVKHYLVVGRKSAHNSSHDRL